MNRALLYAIALAAVAAAPIPSPAGYQQSEADFRAALQNQSTSPSFILITVTDGRDGSVWTDCTDALFLLGAIHEEYALPYDDAGQRKAMEIALSAKAHAFTFRKPAALANIAFNHEPQFRQACDLIRSGKQAYMADRTGQIHEGYPGIPH